MKTQSYSLPFLIRNIMVDIVNPSELDDYQKGKCLKAILGYTLRIHDFNEMYSLLKDKFNRKEVQTLRVNCINSFDLTVKLKHLIYRLIELDINDRNIVIQRFRDIGLAKENANLYFWLDDLDLYDKAVEQKKKAIGQFLPPNEVRKSCQQMMVRLEKSAFIEKFVSKKFAFIVKYNNYDPDDFIYELKRHAINSYYHSLPFKTELHLLNTMKQSVHNAGINIIEKYTSKKRTRLTRHNNSFVMSETTMHNVNSDGEEYEKIINKDNSEEDSFFDLENKMVLRISVNSLMKNKSRLTKRIVRLLMRENAYDFHSFLENEDNVKIEDIDDYCKTYGQEHYNQRLKQFLGITDKRFDKVVKMLREEMT